MNKYAAVFIPTGTREDASQQWHDNGQIYYKPYLYEHTGAEGTSQEALHLPHYLPAVPVHGHMGYNLGDDGTNECQEGQEGLLDMEGGGLARRRRITARMS